MKRDDAMELVTSSLEELAETLKQGKSEAMERYLSAMARFHDYSYRNVMMIIRQFPEATDVAGYSAWKRLNRWVKQGESGIAIFAPMVGGSQAKQRDVQDSDANGTTEKGTSMPIGFRVVHVFDISQTDGQPLPELHRTIGSPGMFLHCIREIYRVMEIRLEFAQLPSGTNGYSLGGVVRVSQGLDDANLFRVLVHELAHELLHQHLAVADRGPLALRETEAEAVACVVCQACGLETMRRSADYIALHQGDVKLLSSSLAKIQRASADIILMLRNRMTENQSTGETARAA